MKPTGITDEAGADIATQIRAAKDLGWKAIELRNAAVRTFPSDSIHELPDEAFEAVATALKDADIGVAAIGSTVANWARSIDEPFEITLKQLDRLIPRAKTLETPYIRIMSYAVRTLKDGSDDPDQMLAERIRRLREIVQRLGDAGLTAVHENCMNYGGMGISHTQQLLEEVPGLKLVFDTGNPVFNTDRDQPAPHPMQDPMAFYKAVRDHVIHVHVKDCLWNTRRQDADYTWPGEGMGKVPEILADLAQHDYDGWISIEPHLSVVFHDTQAGEDSPEKAKAQFDTFVDYGRRLHALLPSRS